MKNLNKKRFIEFISIFSLNEKKHNDIIKIFYDENIVLLNKNLF